MTTSRFINAAERILRTFTGREPVAASVLPMARAIEVEENRARADYRSRGQTPNTALPTLSDEDIGELHVFAMHAWQDGHARCEIDPAHALALADEVLSRRKANS